jgi:hypothetical protein
LTGPDDELVVLAVPPVLTALPHVPVASPPTAPVPFPQTVTGMVPPIGPPLELDEPVLAPPVPGPPVVDTLAVPQVPVALPPAAPVPLPQTVTGMLPPMLPPVDVVEPVLAPPPGPVDPLTGPVNVERSVAVPHVPAADPPRAVVPLPHTLTGRPRPSALPLVELVEPVLAPP